MFKLDAEYQTKNTKGNLVHRCPENEDGTVWRCTGWSVDNVPPSILLVTLMNSCGCGSRRRPSLESGPPVHRLPCSSGPAAPIPGSEPALYQPILWLNRHPQHRPSLHKNGRGNARVIISVVVCPTASLVVVVRPCFRSSSCRGHHRCTEASWYSAATKPASTRRHSFSHGDIITKHHPPA